MRNFLDTSKVWTMQPAVRDEHRSRTWDEKHQYYIYKLVDSDWDIAMSNDGSTYRASVIGFFDSFEAAQKYKEEYQETHDTGYLAGLTPEQREKVNELIDKFRESNVTPIQKAFTATCKNDHDRQMFLSGIEWLVRQFTASGRFSEDVMKTIKEVIESQGLIVGHEAIKPKSADEVLYDIEHVGSNFVD